MLFIKIIILFILFIPCLLVDLILFIFGGWTLPKYKRASVTDELCNLLGI